VKATRRRLILVGVAAALVLGGVGAYALAPHREVASYTVAVAGLVTAKDSAEYTLEGHAGTLHVTFIASAAAAVGDVLLAGEGSPTWGYAARKLGNGCWVVRATSRLDGAWLDANIGDAGGTPGLDIHLRIPKADDFVAGLGPNGSSVLGNSVCLDSEGRAVSAD
jgi:hypothetical protein